MMSTPDDISLSSDQDISIVSRRKWANTLLKKTIQHFAPLPTLIREMPIF